MHAFFGIKLFCQFIIIFLFLLWPFIPLWFWNKWKKHVPKYCHRHLLESAFYAKTSIQLTLTLFRSFVAFFSSIDFRSVGSQICFGWCCCILWQTCHLCCIAIFIPLIRNISFENILMICCLEQLTTSVHNNKTFCGKCWRNNHSLNSYFVSFGFFSSSFFERRRDWKLKMDY